jgi:hypothetical protein
MTTPVRNVPAEPLRAAAVVGSAIRAAALEIELTRRIAADLLEALREAGLFRMVLPRMAAQQHAIIAFHTFEELGRDVLRAPASDDLMREAEVS